MGSISVDGRDLDPTWLQSWRSSIGYVPQDAFVFHASVRDNLRVTCPAAHDDDVWQALDDASARGCVERIPEGLDTVSAIVVSASQASSASASHWRALLRRVQAAVESLRGRLTIVMIAHRLVTVRSADHRCTGLRVPRALIPAVGPGPGAGRGRSA